MLKNSKVARRVLVVKTDSNNNNNNSMMLKLLSAALVAANCLLIVRPPVASGLQQPAARLTSGSSSGAAAAEQSRSRQQYFGSYIGGLSARRNHNISGDVFAVDEQTLFIRRFNYDGLAPDAYFWSSVVAPLPGAAEGFIVPDEKGSTKPLERYIMRDVVLRLPEGKTLREINWLSIWSRQRQENLAEIFIEKSLALPRPLEIGPLSSGGGGGAGGQQNTHGVRSGPITIVDAQTFLVPELHYDGLAPDAYFWLTRGGQGLSGLGFRLKDENGSTQPLKKYSGETVVISLPDELTVYDFDYFGLWCRQFSVNFGQVKIPQQARVPPSPKMLGIKPENKLNCEILYDDLGYEIRWVLDGDDIVMQLVGKIEPTEYMAFGLGKNDSRSEMARADAVVAWVERQSGQVHAVDYYLGGKQQCGEQHQPQDRDPAAASSASASASSAANPEASCPDARLPGGSDSLTLLHGAIVNGYSMVTFKRPQLGIDELYDQHVYSDGQQSVMWAIGQLNARKEVGYHRLRTRGNMFIDFARNPQWNCPIPDLNASMQHTSLPVSASASQLDATFASSASLPTPPNTRQRPAESQDAELPTTAADNLPAAAAGWFVPSIVCPPDRTFHAQIGPTGGRRGYESITGRASWGVSWYINGLMIPELVVERGQSYRFIVEGGNDKTSAPRRHPLYLTDSQEGGFHFKTDEERLKERIFAGVAMRADGQFVPMAEGRLCEWRQTNQTLPNPDQYHTFAAYQRSLRLDCQPGGQAAQLKFSPDATTPDLIYYQCYTHRFMGWRIRVVDSCATYMAAASRTTPSNTNNSGRDLAAAPSVRTERHTTTYSRRNSYESADVGGGLASSGELLFPTSDHAQEGTFMSSTETPLESDMLILNNSQLHQKQPYNLSSFDEVLKLSPADLEFLSEQDLQQLLLQNQQQQQQLELPPQLALQLALLNQLVEPQLFGQQQSLSATKPTVQPTANKTSSRMPKTLQSYMRRLASIYYPVQQQFASMLSNQNSSSSSPQPIGQPPAASQPITSESAPGAASSGPGTGSSSNGNNNGFSLASLMPKPKIDLSKSTLTKKFNKLRFKSGRKLEPTTASGPPRPANEFNYDIFNNQLSQLEKQQRQLQALEFGWQQQQPSETFQHQQQALYPLLGHTNGGFLMDPVTAEQLNYQSSMFSSSSNNNNNMFVPQQHQQRQPKTPAHSTSYQSPPRQPARLELSFSFGNRSRPQQQQQQQQQRQQQQHKQQHQWAPFNQASGAQGDEHAIFITRLPQPLGYAPQYPMPAGWQQQPGQVPARYIGLQPYNQEQFSSRPAAVSYTDAPQHQEPAGHLSSLPSLTMTVHNGDSSKSAQQQQQQQQQPVAQVSGTNELSRPSSADNLSGSDSGSMYEFRQQPSDQVKLLMQTAPDPDPNAASDPDHMLAIERFSKLPSERRPPSIVHPLTGEHILYVDRTQQNSGPFQSGPIMASDQETRPSRPSAEIMDTEQSSVQYHSNDLQRLVNRTASQQQQPATTAEPQQPFLVKPTTQELNQRDKSSAAAIATTTAASATTTELASTQVSPPSIQKQLAEGNLSQERAQFSGRLSQHQVAPLESNLVEPIRSTLVQNDLIAPIQSGGGGGLDGGFINAFNNPHISQLNFDSSPFTPIELSPFGYQPSSMTARLRQPSLIESMYQNQERPEPPVQVASYLSQHLASHNPTLYMTSEKSVASKSPLALSVSLPPSGAASSSQLAGQSNNNSPLARQSAGSANELIILKPSTLTRDNTYILKPEYISTSATIMHNNNNQPQQLSSPEDTYSINSISEPNEASRRLVGIQFDRLSSLSSPPSTSIALDPLQTSHTTNSYNIEHVADNKNSFKSMEFREQKQPTKEAANNSTAAGDTNNNHNKGLHRQASIQIPLVSVLEPNLMGPASSNTAEGVRTNPGGQNQNSNTLLRDNNTDNAILSHVMSLISSNAIATPPLVPVASYSNADYFLPSSDRIYRSLRG